MKKNHKNDKVDNESIIETIETLSDSKTMNDISKALMDYSKGKFVEFVPKNKKYRGRLPRFELGLEDAFGINASTVFCAARLHQSRHSL